MPQSLRGLPANSEFSDLDAWDALARSADEDAFRILFDRHRNVVYNHCFRALADWAAAEDATQAVFMALWRRARAGSVDRLRGDTARPILLQMAHHECLSQIRARSRRLALVDRVSANTPTSQRSQADEWVEAEGTMKLIHESLRVLNQGQRDVVAVVCWDQLSVAEAAQALQISEGTVKSRLSRARAKLAGTPAADLLAGVS